MVGITTRLSQYSPRYEPRGLALAANHERRVDLRGYRLAGDRGRRGHRLHIRHYGAAQKIQIAAEWHA